MKRNKRGISLITLVITIIIMIILAGAIILTLTQSGIFDKANDAVSEYSLKQVQAIADLAWSEAYADGARDRATLQTAVNQALADNDLDDKYKAIATEKGVTVTEITVTNQDGTLGALIKGPDDYGKTIDYRVTVDQKIYIEYDEETGERIEEWIEKKDVEVSEWQVLYEDEKNGYVFLISKNIVGSYWANQPMELSNLTDADKELYEKFRVGNGPKYEFIETEVYTPSWYNLGNIVRLIKEYNNYANKELYGEEYVIGAIGGPTIELLVEGWNAKKYEPELHITTKYSGYAVNDENSLLVENNDYIGIAGERYWTTSPNCNSSYTIFWINSFTDSPDNVMSIGSGDGAERGSAGIRPVVCLSSNIPATIGTKTDFSLMK